MSPNIREDVTSTQEEPNNKKKQRITRFDDNNNNNIVVQLEDFTQLETTHHPYGVLPTGNRWLISDNNTSKTNNDNNTKSNNISLLSTINEENWVHILSYNTGIELGRIGQTCKLFYVISHQQELWRDLVLCKQKVITNVGPTWKDTYVMMLLHNNNYIPHTPICINDIYSDYLYRLHTCRSFSIPKIWYNRDYGNIPCIPVNEITINKFYNEYEKLNKPVIIQNGCQTWDAYKKWNNYEYLQKQTMNQTFRATSGIAQQPGQFTFNAYYDYCTKTNNTEEGPLYLFDRNALKPNSTLWNDYYNDLQKSCPYWDPSNNNDSDDDNNINIHHDLFQYLGRDDEQRPDHTWIIIGGKRSGSVFHIDPNATHAWNATIIGTKHWIFYPPHITPPGVYPSIDGDHVTLPLSIGEWIIQYWDEHNKMKQKYTNDIIECTTFTGDIIFVPHGWWHMVINIDIYNVAITHNYVSKSNLSNVLKFLYTKQEQISGCRDRINSIKPEHLYETFITNLNKQQPQLLQDALSIKHWTCKAWKDNNTENKIKKKKSIIEKAKEKTNNDNNSNNAGFSFSFLS